MDYKRFYSLYNDYNFMLLKAMHFGVYSENLFKNAQDGLEEIICCMLLEPEFLEYKDFLKELYESVIKGYDISKYQSSVNELYQRIVFKKALRNVPVCIACFGLSVLTGIILKITALN